MADRRYAKQKSVSLRGPVIRAALAQRGLTIRDVAERAGYSATTLATSLDGAVSERLASRVAEALGLKPEQVIDKGA